MFYREDKGGQILQEGINEAGAFSSWIAAATSYSNHDTADGPVLHLLLDVRLPARRRPRLGGGRQPGARLPARRHRGAHDAQRRGPAARGRPQPRAQRDDPELRLLRPDVRLRGGGDRPRRPAAHARRAGGRLLLPHADERELPAPADAGGGGGGHPARDVPAARAPTARRCSCSARARSCARSRRRPSCCRTTSASRPTSSARRASPSWRATGWRPSAGTGCIPASRRARRGSRSSSTRGRRSPPPTTCARSPSRSGPTCRGPTPCSAPTATGAATGAACCAPSSRSTAGTSRSRRWGRWPTRARSTSARVQEAIEAFEIDTEVEPPWRR